MNDKTLDKVLVFLIIIIVGAVYLYTVAPTFSFWDCGEFIATCTTLAVPHPPGTPLFIFFGRIWLIVTGFISKILPISRDPGWHLNILCSFLTIGSAVLLYKILSVILRRISGGAESPRNRLVAFGSAIMVAFFYTVWWNALETEIYSVATFLCLLINFIVLRWSEGLREGKPNHKLIVLAFYLMFLFTSIQLMPFLFVIPIYAFIFMLERRYLHDWRLILLGVFQFALFVALFIIPFKGFAVFMLVFAPAAAIILYLWQPQRFSNQGFFWITALLLVASATPELYLPVRSKVLTRLYPQPAVRKQYLAGRNVAPRINECEPGESWRSFMDALHRGQYGPQTLLPRKTQLQTGYNTVQGYFWQMAMYVRYLSQQALPEDVNPAFRFFMLLAFYVAGLGGMYVLFRRDKKLFTMLALTLFMLSFAIVGYLNMKFSPSDSDPKHQDREVRERDYFFHTGFTYFGMFMGIGAFGAAEWFGRRPRYGPALRSGMLVAAAAYAVLPLATNFRVTSRFGNFIPRDYGYNMLVSCDDSSVIFTNGDNDTFPLWFAQEVMGLKRGVIVANLSLINTDWYIRQLKAWGAPITFSNYVINRLQPVAVGNRFILVKDIMIREILAANAGIRLNEGDYFSPQGDFAAKYLKGYRGQRTIYFSSTVSEDNFKGFAPYLRLEGLVYRVVSDSVAPPHNIDVARTQDLFYRVYRYTGVFDPEQQKVLAGIMPDFPLRKTQREFYNFPMVKDDNTRRLYTNYAAGLFALGLDLRERNDLPAAEDAWRFALAFEPEPDYPFLYNLGILFAQQGRPDSAAAYLARIKTKDPQLLTQIGSAFGVLGAYDKSVELLRQAIRINPRFAPAYSALVTVYVNRGDRPSAIQILNDWLRLNPRDSIAVNILKELQKP
jgi:tetratricopeptide (TPR) repeat protein